MAAATNSTGNPSNVIPLPKLTVEMHLSELAAMLDAMIYMHEVADEDDRRRVMLLETSLLHVMLEKTQSAQKALEKIGRRAA